MSEKPEDIELYERALEIWGRNCQLYLVMEECGELINAISKLLRKETITKSEAPETFKHNIIKEAEDVRIMLNELEYVIIQEPELWEKYRKAVFDAFKLRVQLWDGIKK